MGFMQTASGDGGDFKVYVKYNAKAGRWYTKEDKPDAEDFEVTDMTAVFDFKSLKTGWFLFAPGVAPVKQLNDELRHWAVKPSPDFKQGFQIDVFSNKNLLGVREFASTAGAVIEAMNNVYDDYDTRRSRRRASCRSSNALAVKPIVSKHGTNYQPVLADRRMDDRPAELTEPQSPFRLGASRECPYRKWHGHPPGVHSPRSLRRAQSRTAIGRLFWRRRAGGEQPRHHRSRNALPWRLPGHSPDVAQGGRSCDRSALRHRLEAWREPCAPQ
jgi:hypothetical protein